MLRQVTSGTLRPAYVTMVFVDDDVIKWKHFPRYWLFVRGIHRWPVNSPHKGQWRGFDPRLIKRFSKQSRHRWFETPSRPLWRYCNGWPGQDDVITWKRFLALYIWWESTAETDRVPSQSVSVWEQCCFLCCKSEQAVGKKKSWVTGDLRRLDAHETALECLNHCACRLYIVEWGKFGRWGNMVTWVTFFSLLIHIGAEVHMLVNAEFVISTLVYSSIQVWIDMKNNMVAKVTPSAQTSPITQ